MTRLTTADLRNLEGSLTVYDTYLRDATGHDLAGLALVAAGLPDDGAARRGLAELEFAVVPISGGLGLIGGFAQSVAAILTHLGCPSVVTRATDVAGMAEAVAGGPAALFMSDDRDFVALDTGLGISVHNTPATARGFVAGLAGMAAASGGLGGREVLVLGCGAVGAAAADALLARGARLVLADRMAERQARLRETLVADGHAPERIRLMAADTLGTPDLIFDATNTGDHIDTDRVTESALVAAPGMPCGITAAARRRLGIRLLHDPLQLGVATMAAEIYAARVGETQPVRRKETHRG